MLSFATTIVYLMFIAGPLAVNATFLGSELIYEYLLLSGFVAVYLMIARVAMLCGRGLVHSYLLLGVSILLPMASIPAIAFSNGFVVAIILIFLFFDKNKVNFDIALKRLRKQRGADLKAITTSTRKS